MNDVMKVLTAHASALSATETREILDALIQQDQYVGHVYGMSYGQALVQVHDHDRQKTGGIPGLSFLVASRKVPEDTFDSEDASVLLLRVIDSAPLPSDREAERLRVEAAQRAATEQAMRWDSKEIIDSFTLNNLGYAGLKCRILGTFYLVKQKQKDGPEKLVLRFGSDISNFYSNSALRAYKPNGSALREIVNYLDPELSADPDLVQHRVEIGKVRYASTARVGQKIDDVRVSIAPTDLLNMKTALFGMTRTGKSNTTKIMVRSVFDLRYQIDKGRIGQLIFDINGEYANVNVQDAGAIKNVWKSNKTGNKADVTTYGLLAHPDDPGRNLLKINFYADDMLGIGKSMLDQKLQDDKAQFVTAFKNVDLEMRPDPNDKSGVTRWNRRVLVYRALLKKARYDVPSSMQLPKGFRLFSEDLVGAMQGSTHEKSGVFSAAGKILGDLSAGNKVTWDQLVNAFEGLNDFIVTKDSGYSDFNSSYLKKSSSGQSWADQDLTALLGMIGAQYGAGRIRELSSRHDGAVTDDYAVKIHRDLEAGRLVIVDQSLGSEELNQIVADRIIDYIFKEHQRRFSNSLPPPSIMVYVEEAHNRLPKGSEDDPTLIWPRVAKEGAKLKIGMVYATQEVSSIQKNILKNTSNWFIGHLNNTDETKELARYYDFSDYEDSIRRAQNPGFLRVKTRSNPYVIPVQIDRFEMPKD